MGWDEIQKGSGDGAFVKFDTDKPVKIHLLNDKVETKGVHWPQVGKGAAIDCTGAGCLCCADQAKYKAKQLRHTVEAYVFALKMTKKLEGGNGIFLNIKDIRESYGNTLDKVDLVITKRDQNSKISYTVVPVPTVFTPTMLVDHDPEGTPF